VRDGVLQAVSAPINLRVPIAAVPDRATLISPDFSGEKPLAVSQVGDYLTVTLPGLEAYSVVLLHYGQEPSLDRLTDPVRLRPVARWARPATAEFRVRGDGSVAHGEDLSGFLQGMLHTELRNPPVFLLNSRKPGEFRVHVRAVASAGARLSVRIDNGPATLIDLPDRDGKNDGRAPEYDRTFAFPVPAGAHRIALDNTGPDWLTLEWLEFTGTFDD
jgi:hypothetical protein